MYDVLKRKCNNAKKFYERQYKLNAKTQFDKGRAIGSIKAYEYILNEIEKIEEYINRKNKFKI